jgi:hypothetical protein
MGKKGSWDNTYEATFGEDGVGWKAQAVLGQVKVGACTRWNAVQLTRLIST